MELRLQRLLDLLGDDDGDGGTVGTSLRLPVRLREAPAVAIELGIDASATELSAQGLRAVLEAFAQRAVLDAYYEAHPAHRPSLAEIALATAELDGHPLAAQPELIHRAAEAVGHVKDDPTPDDVLVYAAGLAAAAGCAARGRSCWKRGGPGAVATPASKAPTRTGARGGRGFSQPATRRQHPTGRHPRRAGG